MIFRVDDRESIIYTISMNDSLAWLANDTTPKLTWDSILKPGGVADQSFDVVTPDPREKDNNLYFGIIEAGILVVAVLFVYTFFSQK